MALAVVGRSSESIWMADEVKRRLARKILKREQAVDNFHEGPTQTDTGATSDGSRRRPLWTIVVAVLWAASIGVGVATGSVVAGFATMVGGAIVCRSILFMPPFWK